MTNSPHSPQPHNSRRHLTLLDFLSLLAGVAGCSGSVLAGRNIGRPLTGWFIGLVIGLGCCSAIWKVGGMVIDNLKLAEPKLPPSRVVLEWLLCIFLFVWIAVSALIGYWVIKLAVRFFT